MSMVSSLSICWMNVLAIHLPFVQLSISLRGGPSRCGILTQYLGVSGDWLLWKSAPLSCPRQFCSVSGLFIPLCQAHSLTGSRTLTFLEGSLMLQTWHASYCSRHLTPWSSHILPVALRTSLREKIRYFSPLSCFMRFLVSVYICTLNTGLAGLPLAVGQF